MNTIVVKINSGYNADGFSIRVEDETRDRLFEQSYAYGYNASYNRGFASETKPYVTNIIVDIVNKYDAEKLLLCAGKYALSGESMTDEDIANFAKKYIMDNIQLLSILQNKL